MNTFTIGHGDNTIRVEQQDKERFIVRLEERTIKLLKKEDNEGANHWFEEGCDNETPEAKALGNAIHHYEVEEQEKQQFVVKLEARTIRLVQKEDNEGANHWFEEGSDNETPETKALGNAIDNYLAKVREQ